MRNQLLLLLMLLSSMTISAQFVYKIKADSLLVTNDSCTAEFILENSTKNVKGFLVNKGNGRTEFRRAQSLTDSTFVVAGDTILIRGTGGGGGGGSTPSWQQTLNVSRLSKSNLIFDTAAAKPSSGSSVSKNVITVRALDTLEGTPPYLMGTSAIGFSGGTTHAMSAGWNLNPDGTINTASKVAIGEMWEQRIRQTGGLDHTGKSDVYGRPNGSIVRLGSYSINNSNGTILFYHTANRFSVKASEVAGAGSNYYFDVQGNAGTNDGTTMTMSTLTGSLIFSNLVNGTSANFIVNANYPGSNNAVNFANFVHAGLPGTVTLYPGPDGNGTTIVMYDSNSIHNTVLVSLADRFQVTQKGTGDFLYQNNTGLKVRFYNTRNYFQNAMSIGFDNDPTGAVDARTTTRVYGVHAVTSSTTEGYGVSGTANGSGASYNAGGLFTASGATNNIGVWITAMNTGTNNYNLYAEGTAKSYINGPIGIKNNSPTAYLHLAAGTATANTAPLKLTSGTNLTTPEAGAVEFDGTNYYATTSSTRYTLAKTLTTTSTLDFGSTAAGAKSDLTISLTGAASGDVVSVGVPNGSVPANGSFTAWVSASNTVTVRFTNNDLTNAYDPASGSFRVSIIKY